MRTHGARVTTITLYSTTVRRTLRGNVLLDDSTSTLMRTHGYPCNHNRVVSATIIQPVVAPAPLRTPENQVTTGPVRTQSPMCVRGARRLRPRSRRVAGRYLKNHLLLGVRGGPEPPGKEASSCLREGQQFTL